MNKSDCFRLGDLYRDLSSQLDILEHELPEKDLPKIREAFGRIWSRAQIIQKEFFAGGNLLIAEIMKVASDNVAHVRWVEQHSHRSVAAHIDDWRGGIAYLRDLIDNLLFKILSEECGT